MVNLRTNIFHVAMVILKICSQIYMTWRWIYIFFLLRKWGGYLLFKDTLVASYLVNQSESEVRHYNPHSLDLLGLGTGVGE